MSTQAYENTFAVADTAGIPALEAHIRHRLSRRVHDFRLAIQKHGLILKGRARTYYAKQLAQHAVMAVTDLPILANDIDVY